MNGQLVTFFIGASIGFVLAVLLLGLWGFG